MLPCCAKGFEVLGLAPRGVGKGLPYGYRLFEAVEMGDITSELLMLPEGLNPIPPKPGVRPVGEACSWSSALRTSIAGGLIICWVYEWVPSSPTVGEGALKP